MLESSRYISIYSYIVWFMCSFKLILMHVGNNVCSSCNVALRVTACWQILISTIIAMLACPLVCLCLNFLKISLHLTPIQSSIFYSFFLIFYLFLPASTQEFSVSTISSCTTGETWSVSEFFFFICPSNSVFLM